ncbi:MAG: ribonuclease E activity regulator RraA [Firmicutes bacterium]|nr:ribonuclease E activity regulator RraA [Bacillota bacterium]
MKTADVCDQYHEELQICEPMFRSFGGKQQFSGPIATVKVFEDNVLVREALETVPEGSVLVVDGGGSKQCALMGDRLGEIAVSRGLAGVIINGCVRDSAELSQMEIGVMALAPMPLKSRKEGKGDRDIPVTFGGVNWEPGHYVYADEDGIVVSPRSLEF